MGARRGVRKRLPAFSSVSAPAASDQLWQQHHHQDGRHHEPAASSRLWHQSSQHPRDPCWREQVRRERRSTSSCPGACHRCGGDLSSGSGSGSGPMSLPGSCGRLGLLGGPVAVSLDTGMLTTLPVDLVTGVSSPPQRRRVSFQVGL